MSTPAETPGNPPEGVTPAQPNTPPSGAPAEPAKAFDQETVDRIVAERLNRERQKYSDYNDLKAQAAKLAEIEDAQKTEQQRLTERADQEAQARSAAEQRAQELEVQLLRQKVAIAKGLTPAQAGRLQGSSEEEIAADADELLAAFTAASPQTPARTPVAQLQPGAIPPGSAVAPDMNAWMRQRAPRTN